MWKHYKGGHGKLGAGASSERSCNVCYYTLGKRMAPRKQVQWYRRFGLGQDTSVALDDEASGNLPTVGDNPGPRAQRNAIFMGIGQGPVAWTPLQAASAYATLARGGRKLGPTFVKPGHRKTARDTKTLDLDPAAVGQAMQGLYRVVNGDNGTGRQLHLDDPEPIFNVEHLRVFGKSGTADAGNRWIDKNLNEEVDPGEVIPDAGDHAWFMAMPQPESADRPPYVIAVVVEYGGSGSQVAGPIANQIIHALIEEGYLPEAAADDGERAAGEAAEGAVS
jgi:penicillin-binding protein 2